MLTVLIITQFVLWIIGFFIRGFTLYQLCLVTVPICFSLRKFGIKVSYGSLIAIEILLLFFSTIFTLMFSEIDVTRYILSLIVRIISIIIAIVDDTMYIYVTEERKKR